VQAFNRGESEWEAATAKKPLDTDTLLEEARVEACLSDFGDEGFREPLGIFLRSLEEEAHLHLLGRYEARLMVLRLLENRLKIVETLRKDPGIAEEAMSAPIFVTGMARTGTSILHELLVQDPALRGPLTWEMWYPAPPPEPNTHDTDPRIDKTQREVKRWELIAPPYRAMHEMDAQLPNECPPLMAHEFMSSWWGGTYDIPGFSAWLAGADIPRAYAMHRRLLQLLQRRFPTRRWALKDPSNLGVLPAVLAVYPDALILVTHRDPLQALASVASLVATLKWMHSDRVDYEEIARSLAMGQAFLFDQLTDWREGGVIPKAQIYDVRYSDLMADPFGTIAGTYNYFGLPFTEEAEARMRAWLAAKPKGRTGVHRYSFEDTGLDMAAERQRFARYQEHYDIPNEA
jgi:hypothetical protein